MQQLHFLFRSVFVLVMSCFVSPRFSCSFQGQEDGIVLSDRSCAHVVYSSLSKVTGHACCTGAVGVAG